jgi:Nucleotide-binding protein implicated in inhibition of septum formation
LRAAGYEFEIVVADVDERVRDVKRQRSTCEGWRRRSRQRSRLPTRSSSAPTRPWSSDGEILGKPRDDDEAAAMLRRLADGVTRC